MSLCCALGKKERSFLIAPTPVSKIAQMIQGQLTAWTNAFPDCLIKLAAYSTSPSKADYLQLTFSKPKTSGYYITYSCENGTKKNKIHDGVDAAFEEMAKSDAVARAIAIEPQLECEGLVSNVKSLLVDEGDGKDFTPKNITDACDSSFDKRK